MTAVRKLRARVKAWSSRSRHCSFLDNEEFRFAAECERMRVDRNGSVLSLLLIKLPAKHARNSDLGFLARLLEGRLRVTDTPGVLSDGRVGVLLPDTPAAGAWKVAEDVSEAYPAGPERPECEVITYPDSGVPRGWAPDAETETGGSETVGAPHDDPGPQPSDFFFARPLPPWKRALDIAGATVGLAASLPIIAAAGAAIKLTSPGPIFYTQERTGLAGRKFRIYKLRTMDVDAHRRQSGLRAKSQQDGPAFKLQRDPRTTRVGRLLRMTSADELPQFLNVLRGEMSLVGPRPLPTDESAACTPWQRRRLTVTPGMTCTWQITSRGTVSFDEWVRMDLRYARSRDPWSDLKMLLQTLPALIIQRGLR